MWARARGTWADRPWKGGLPVPEKHPLAEGVLRSDVRYGP